jgi:hypothetical protein
MKKECRQCSAAFKGKLARKAIYGILTLSELAQKYAPPPFSRMTKSKAPRCQIGKVNVMRYLNNLERLRSKMRIPEQTAPHSGEIAP